MVDQGIHDIKVACFRIGSELYAMDIMRIREIIRPQKLASIPRFPDFIEGVLNLRGAIIPVIDMHKRFELPQGGDEQGKRLLIVTLAGCLLGVAVDEVTEVITVHSANIKPPPRITGGIGAEYLIGVCLVGLVGEDMVMLLNPDRLLTGSETSELLVLDELEESPPEADFI